MSFPVINGTEVLLPPPDGWVVNLTHPYRDETTKAHVLLAFGLEFPISTLFLIQRLYTSYFVLRKLQPEDCKCIPSSAWKVKADRILDLITAGWGLLLATQAMMLHLWRLGLVGLHAWEQSLDKSIYMTGVILALTLTAIVGTLLSKLALCVFYYRLSPARWYQYSIMFTGFLCLVCFGSVFFAVLFACRPISAAWNLRLYTGDNCIPRPPWYILQAITGGVTDFLLMINPIPTVLGLQMSTKHKAALIAWFGIGTITLAAAIMRTISLLSMINSSDTPWTMADAMLWLVVESNLVVLCACLPTFRVWLSHVFSRRGLSASGNSGVSHGKHAQGSHPLRTFGQGKTRRFDTVAEIERDNAKADDDFGGTEPPVSRNGAAISDAGSEENILQARTTVVSSSAR